MSTSERLVAARWPELARRMAVAELVELAWADEGDVPTLVADGIRLWSAFDPRGEARLLARLVPVDADEACVYGASHTELIRALLARPHLRRLRVVVLNPAVLAAVLALVDPHDWLEDPRVELVDGAALRELEWPFAAASGELRVPAAETARLSDLVQLELRTPHARRHQRRLEAHLREHVAGNREHLAHDPDVARLFGTRAGETVCIAAAGPTLATHFERLRDERATLVAVDAALKPLVAAGIRPDLVVTIDPHVEGMRRVFDVGAEASLEATGLVYLPVVLPEVVRAWPGPRFAAYGRDAFYDALEEELPHTRLWTSGSVLHPAVDLAVRLGAERIELFGADFANVGGRTHVAGAAWETAAASRAVVHDALGRPVPSQPNLIGYLRDLERYVERHPEVRFVNAGRGGAAIAGTVPLGPPEGEPCPQPS